MRTLTLLASLILLLTPSCVVGYGSGWAGGALGTDATKLNIGPKGINATDLKQSPGLKEAGKRLFYNTVAGAVVGPLANGLGGAIKNVTKP